MFMVFEPKTPPTILPVIVSNDYDAFRGILRSDIADTYNKWLNLFAQWEKMYSSNGETIRSVKVDPSEFSRYLDATGTGHSLNSLFVFAGLIADGHHY
jgi:hypothetical protein